MYSHNSNVSFQKWILTTHIQKQLLTAFLKEIIIVSQILITKSNPSLPIYSWFHIKGTWGVHTFNGDYLSIPKCTGRAVSTFFMKSPVCNTSCIKVRSWKRFGSAVCYTKYTIYLSLSTQRADLNLFRGTYCILHIFMHLIWFDIVIFFSVLVGIIII